MHEGRTKDMDPEALETAFKKYPDVKLVVFAHPYGFSGQIDTIKNICEKHDAKLGARKYFYPLTNTFSAFHGKYDVNETPIALHVSKGVLTLPMFADLRFEDVDRICETICSLLKRQFN